MKNFILLSLLVSIFPVLSRADVLPAKEANLICRTKALRAVRSIADSKHRFLVSYKIARVAEISTRITYEYRVQGIDSALYTVIAYAYPDDRSCLIGSVTNNTTGND